VTARIFDKPTSRSNFRLDIRVPQTYGSCGARSGRKCDYRGEHRAGTRAD
jgi:hypothetical protein